MGCQHGISKEVLFVVLFQAHKFYVAQLSIDVKYSEWDHN